MANLDKDRTQTPEYRLEKITQELGERIGWSIKGSTQYVQNNPVKGVAIAAAAGLVVGSLLTMILRRRPPQC